MLKCTWRTFCITKPRFLWGRIWSMGSHCSLAMSYWKIVYVTSCLLCSAVKQKRAAQTDKGKIIKIRQRKKNMLSAARSTDWTDSSVALSIEHEYTNIHTHTQHMTSPTVNSPQHCSVCGKGLRVCFVVGQSKIWVKKKKGLTVKDQYLKQSNNLDLYCVSVTTKYKRP